MRPSYLSYGQMGAIKRRPSMTSKTNICAKCYDSDSSGKKLDKRQVEDKWSLETLHLSYTLLSDVIVVLKKPESCICCWSTPQRPPPEWLSLLFIVDTRYSVEDIEGALLKQLKASKDTSIAVKKPEDENIRFTNYGNLVWT